jgi:hypothetical protein
MIHPLLSSKGISAIAALSTFLALPSSAATPSPESLFNDLQLAICLNNWDSAVSLAGSLIASPDLTPAYRENLVDLRNQLQTYQQRNSVIVPPPGCNALVSRNVAAAPNQDAFEVDSFSELGVDQRPVIPDQSARQLAAAERAGLTALQDTPISALSPALLIQTPTGTGISAGSVAKNVDVFSFLGRENDLVTLEINVTDVLPGSLYTDDDSQIFLFDSEGTLLAENDDLSRLQSQIQDFALPATGVYYIAITTYNNDPILDSIRRITGWTGNGGSAVEYTLTVRGLTPSNQFISPEALQ